MKESKEKIPTSVGIEDSDLIYNLPLLVEAPVTYRKKEKIANPNRGDSKAERTDMVNTADLEKVTKMAKR